MAGLVCRIELDKKKGITLKVENKDGNITQTAVLDGKSITITCKGKEETSVITQKPESIDLKCKTFTLEAETITCKSTKDTVHKSDEKFDIQSTKDMTLDSKAKLTEKAGQDFSISGKNVAVSAATGDVKFAGMNIKTDAKTNVEVNGLSLKFAAKTSAEMEGKASVKISSTGMAEIDGSSTTVKGKITQVSGPMVKIG